MKAINMQFCVQILLVQYRSLAKQFRHREICTNQVKHLFMTFTVSSFSSNVTKYYQMSSFRCELEGHAVSPDTGLDIDIVETIDYQDFFEVSSL